MSTVGYATLDVIPSVKGLAGELQKQTSGDLTRAGQAGGKRYGAAAGAEAAGGFKSRFGSAMKGFAPLAGLVGGASIVAGFKSAIDGASELSESTSKVEVVFGGAAKSVLKFADDAEKGLGQSEAQALEAAGTFGNLLRSIGLTETVSAEFSTTMVGLASDLASFNNSSVDEALTALRSGLIGETEPLKRFGVNLNDATLKAKALELGLSDGKATLDSNAKAQAAYALIMEQTALAQGDFARTSDGLANQTKILGAQWTELTTTVGAELLPAVTGFVSFMNDDGIPALAGAGGVAKDLGSAFAGLPGPVKAAAAAFVALRIASATGLTDGIARGVGSASSAIDSLRIRTMLAADAYTSARSVTREFAGTTARVSTGVGRASASLTGLRSAAQGAGGALKSGIGGAVGLLGGPWSAALIAGTALLTHFWQEHEEAKSRVDAFTASLDESTGAITEQTYRAAADELKDWSTAAGAAGISGEELASAVVEGGSALDDLSRKFAEYQDRNAGTAIFDAVTGDSRDFRGALFGLHDELGKGQAQWKFAADAASGFEGAVEGSDTATRVATRGLGSYAEQIDKVRGKLEKLINKEKERALNAIQSRRDQIALRETLNAAREEAAKGKTTLDRNTQAGRDNMSALLDLADQWSTSTPKVQNARGAYENMRGKFVEVAESMGATKDEAKKLANELLKVPKKAPLKFQSEGYKKLMAEIAALKEAAANVGNVSMDFKRGGFATPNSEGGPPSAAPSARPRRGNDGNGADGRHGVNINIENMQPHDYNDFMTQAQRKHQQASLGGRP